MGGLPGGFLTREVAGNAYHHLQALGWRNLADAADLKSVAERREGSNPSPGTTPSGTKSRASLTRGQRSHTLAMALFVQVPVPGRIGKAVKIRRGSATVSGKREPGPTVGKPMGRARQNSPPASQETCLDER